MPEHPNLATVRRIGRAVQSGDIAAASEVLAEDVVWHYFNPRLPDLAGDYTGAIGLQSLFHDLARLSRGSFRVEPVSMEPVGDELVFTHVRVHLVLEERKIATDAVVVWRVREGRAVEVWDIPAAGANRPREASIGR
jgi:uncharacterized protein